MLQSISTVNILKQYSDIHALHIGKQVSNIFQDLK